MRFQFYKSAAARRSHQRFGRQDVPDGESMVEMEIRRHRASPRTKMMNIGEQYYCGIHQILKRERTAIGAQGKVQNVENLPCSRLVDNQYRKLVDQKTNYLLGKPLCWRCGDKNLSGVLSGLFDRRFLRELKNLCRDTLNEGIGWLYLYYDKDGKLSTRRFSGREIIPVWRDEGHTALDYAIRIYDGEEWNGREFEKITLVAVFDDAGVHHFRLQKDRLLPRREGFIPYFTDPQKSFGQIPLVPFRANAGETALIGRVKGLQDALNTILSNFEDAMLEDVRNTILVLVNYDGEDLGEFRHNLATYGAVKVKSVDGVGGDLKTLQIEVNHENYESIISLIKKAIIENGMGFDGRGEGISGNLNELEIRSRYADVDLEANEMESEWQASLEELTELLVRHAVLAGIPPENGRVQYIFNRDMLMNENDVIDACEKSLSLLSKETVVANHPWVEDVAGELARIDREQTKQTEEETE